MASAEFAQLSPPSSVHSLRLLLDLLPVLLVEPGRVPRTRSPHAGEIRRQKRIIADSKLNLLFLSRPTAGLPIRVTERLLSVSPSFKTPSPSTGEFTLERWQG